MPAVLYRLTGTVGGIAAAEFLDHGLLAILALVGALALVGVGKVAGLGGAVVLAAVAAASALADALRLVVDARAPCAPRALLVAGTRLRTLSVVAGLLPRFPWVAVFLRWRRSTGIGLWRLVVDANAPRAPCALPVASARLRALPVVAGLFPRFPGIAVFLRRLVQNALAPAAPLALPIAGPRLLPAVADLVLCVARVALFLRRRRLVVDARAPRAPLALRVAGAILVSLSVVAGLGTDYPGWADFLWGRIGICVTAAPRAPLSLPIAVACLAAVAVDADLGLNISRSADFLWGRWVVCEAAAPRIPQPAVVAPTRLRSLSVVAGLVLLIARVALFLRRRRVVRDAVAPRIPLSVHVAQTRLRSLPVVAELGLRVAGSTVLLWGRREHRTGFPLPPGAAVVADFELSPIAIAALGLALTRFADAFVLALAELAVAIAGRGSALTATHLLPLLAALNLAVVPCSPGAFRRAELLLRPLAVLAALLFFCTGLAGAGGTWIVSSTDFALLRFAGDALRERLALAIAVVAVGLGGANHVVAGRCDVAEFEPVSFHHPLGDFGPIDRIAGAEELLVFDDAAGHAVVDVGREPVVGPYVLELGQQSHRLVFDGGPDPVVVDLEVLVGVEGQHHHLQRFRTADVVVRAELLGALLAGCLGIDDRVAGLGDQRQRFHVAGIAVGGWHVAGESRALWDVALLLCSDLEPASHFAPFGELIGPELAVEEPELDAVPAHVLDVLQSPGVWEVGVVGLEIAESPVEQTQRIQEVGEFGVVAEAVAVAEDSGAVVLERGLQVGQVLPAAHT